MVEEYADFNGPRPAQMEGRRETCVRPIAKLQLPLLTRRILVQGHFDRALVNERCLFETKGFRRTAKAKP